MDATSAPEMNNPSQESLVSIQPVMQTFQHSRVLQIRTNQVISASVFQDMSMRTAAR
jgi:hypothetical protein